MVPLTLKPGDRASSSVAQLPLGATPPNEVMSAFSSATASGSLAAEIIVSRLSLLPPRSADHDESGVAPAVAATRTSDQITMRSVCRKWRVRTTHSTSQTLMKK